MNNPIERLKAVLCDPDGNVCVRGSDADRKEIQEALQSLTAKLEAAEKENVLLTVQFEAARNTAAGLSDMVLEKNTTITEQAAQIEELKVGAERYRWHVKLYAKGQGLSEEVIVEELDAAIAKAREVKS